MKESGDDGDDDGNNDDDDDDEGCGNSGTTGDPGTTQKPLAFLPSSLTNPPNPTPCSFSAKSPGALQKVFCSAISYRSVSLTLSSSEGRKRGRSVTSARRENMEGSEDLKQAA